MDMMKISGYVDAELHKNTKLGDNVIGPTEIGDKAEGFSTSKKKWKS